MKNFLKDYFFELQKKYELSKMWNIAKTLSPYLLQDETTNDECFFEKKVIIEKNYNKFLNYYSSSGIKYALKQYGIYQKILNKGYDDIIVCITGLDFYSQRLHLYGIKEKEKYLVGEIIVKDIHYHYPYWKPFEKINNNNNFNMVRIEWFLLQNPLEEFSKDRPRLIAQEYPGLGIGYEIMELLIIMAKRLKKDGYINTPMYFNNAYMYSKRFLFVDPEKQGEFMKIKDSIGNRTLQEVSLAVHAGFLYDKNKKEIYKWTPSDVFVPLGRNLIRWLKKGNYYKIMLESYKKNDFYFDWKNFDDKKQELISKISEF